MHPVSQADGPDLSSVKAIYCCNNSGHGDRQQGFTAKLLRAAWSLRSSQPIAFHGSSTRKESYATTREN